MSGLPKGGILPGGELLAIPATAIEGAGCLIGREVDQYVLTPGDIKHAVGSAGAGVDRDQTCGGEGREDQSIAAGHQRFIYGAD